MKKLKMPRVLLLGFLFWVITLLQGCVPVATGVIAYDSAISFQKHAAYTEYLFAAQAKNKSLEQAGEPPAPIFSQGKWETEIYKPRLEYAGYFTRQTSANAPIHSFEVWKKIDYPLIQQTYEKARLQGRAPSQRQ